MRKSSEHVRAHVGNDVCHHRRKAAEDPPLEMTSIVELAACRLHALHFGQDGHDIRICMSYDGFLGSP